MGRYLIYVIWSVATFQVVVYITLFFDFDLLHNLMSESAGVLLSFAIAYPFLVTRRRNLFARIDTLKEIVFCFIRLSLFELEDPDEEKAIENNRLYTWVWRKELEARKKRPTILHRIIFRLINCLFISWIFRKKGLLEYYRYHVRRMSDSEKYGTYRTWLYNVAMNVSNAEKEYKRYPKPRDMEIILSKIMRFSDLSDELLRDYPDTWDIFSRLMQVFREAHNGRPFDAGKIEVFKQFTGDELSDYPEKKEKIFEYIKLYIENQQVSFFEKILNTREKYSKLLYAYQDHDMLNTYTRSTRKDITNVMGILKTPKRQAAELHHSIERTYIPHDHKYLMRILKAFEKFIEI